MTIKIEITGGNGYYHQFFGSDNHVPRRGDLIQYANGQAAEVKFVTWNYDDNIVEIRCIRL